MKIFIEYPPSFGSSWVATDSAEGLAVLSNLLRTFLGNNDFDSIDDDEFKYAGKTTVRTNHIKDFEELASTMFEIVKIDSRSYSFESGAKLLGFEIYHPFEISKISE